ncbi:hypothetical protein DSM112329_00682 [Paraconexibacter sp. AEG42_29]|uniref:Blue (type 1) copper domain-containing protein n=1 Tax=Paraconexibacter sp. AEG42_29 TaxID=2997339 RepID=A0AAU7AQF0_9ACTN
MRRAALMGTIGTAGITVAAGAGALPARAQDTAGVPVLEATADGNAFGNLGFTPATADVVIGQTIHWRNTNRIAPHTVTEPHGLFDLTGNAVGGTASSPAGFGPGSTVELTAFAGTTTYICRVHPGRMSGVFRAPVVTALGPGYKAPRIPARTKAGKARRAELKKNFQRRLTLTWATVEPTEGQAYDVQVKRGAGPWKPLLTRTVDTTITIASGKRGTTSKVRARMRQEKDESRGTGWSPEVMVRP